ncbi:MAG: phosphoglycerate dehydrogenase, partial [Nitrospirae bacterium]|nr:phosphoglycerate dehydrogenase [Nitrospirota bacterium]
MKILVSDAISERGIEILRNAGLEVDVKTKLTPEDLLQTIGGYEGLVVRSNTQVTAAALQAGKRLKVVGRAGAGLDNIDVPAATKQGIVVMNTPGGNTITTAEHAISMLLSLIRNIPQAMVSVKGGKWEKSRFMGLEFYNKTLGIVGLGRVGGYVAKLALGLKMNVIAFDPYLSQENAAQMGIEPVTLEEVFRRSDFITVHSPLTPETRSLIGRKAFEMMKPGVLLVNCARGGIVNEQDLFDALVSKRVAGAAFDVFEKEPVDPKHPLLTLDNFICTPHLGASTVEAQENVALDIAEAIVDYLTRGIIRNAANFPSVPPEMLPRLQPYLTLAEKLGSFQAHLCEGGIRKVTVEYRGKVSELPIAPLTVATLKGLLTPFLEDTVNYVNASLVAGERGIEVREVKNKDAGDYVSLILLTVQTDQKTSSSTGALFSRTDHRIIELDGFPLEVVPEGYMLVLSNQDKPGV